MRLTNRVAVVTGAAAGLGMAIAQRFASEGALVIIADKNEAAIPSAVDAIRAAGGKAVGVTLDVTSRKQIGDVMAAVVADHGRIDILINNAGITMYRPFSTIADEDWDTVLAVDLKGAFFCVQAAAPFMTQQSYGKIVNVSSAAGTGTTPLNAGGSPAGNAAYASAKAGLILLTKTLARELGPHGITVNCVAPGSFLTAMTKASRTPEQVAEHVAARSRSAVLGRQGLPEELANAALFLASDESSFITGHTLNVDGGRIDRM